MIPRTIPFLIRLGGLIFLTLLAASCGFGRQATGIVVWAPDGAAVKNGDLVWVWESSRIRKTLKIQRPQGGDSFEVDQWRVKTFPGEGEAKAFQTDFAPLNDTWATSGKQGLPVREAPEATSNRIYKLGENDEVKVLVANRPKVKEGNLEGSWVQILTHDGYTGWVFDYYLTLETHGNGQSTQLKASGSGDQLIQTVLAQSWYPQEMRDMVDQDRINLTLFRPDAGMRAQASPPSFLVVLPGGPDGQDERIELPVEPAQKLNDLTYSFGGPDQVKVQFANVEGSKIVLTFNWQGKARTIPLALLDGNAGTYISRELASRQQKLNEILTRGHTLTSPTYGTLKLTAEGGFLWEGYKTAFADVTTGQGRIAFDWSKDKKLFDEFGDDKTGVQKVFLYRFLKDGFQLIPTDQTDLDPTKQTVTGETHGDTTLFFTFQD